MDTYVVILFYVICIVSEGFLRLLFIACFINVIFHYGKLLCLISLELNSSVFYVCFVKLFHLIYRLYHIIRHHHPVT